MRSLRVILLTSAIAVSVSNAQTAAVPAAPTGPQVGEAAPDFLLPTATKDGVGKPVSLAALKGQVVVIAFFPRARTTGCTAQMNAYRDQYAELFKGGKGVTVLATSSDADTTQANWAKDAGYPVTFMSDSAITLSSKFGVPANPTRKTYQRVLFVIGKDGKIAHVMRPFRELVGESYTELGGAIDAALKR
jgi:peroxiredoxin Q/BCP